MFPLQLSERICSYQAINYTFIIDTNDKNGRMFGPYYQNGSNAISKTFTSDFDKDRDYSLTVVIETSAGRIASNTYYFSKFGARLHHLVT